MKYVYFVSHSANTGDGAGFGNSEVSRDRPISSIDEIREIENLIREAPVAAKLNVTAVRVLNFQLLRTVEA